MTNGWAVVTILSLGVLPTLAGLGFLHYVHVQRERDCRQRVESREELRESFFTLYDLISLQIESDEGRAFVQELRSSVLGPLTVEQCLKGGD